jgi:hypothetical protein
MGGDPTLTEPGLSGAFNAHLSESATYWDIYNTGEDSGNSAIFRIRGGNNANLRILELYNSTGVQTDGSHDYLDGKESQVIHHYNDKEGSILDYCGRNGTARLTRMAYNADSSGHASAGTGWFDRFERTVLHDPNYVYPDNRTLAGFKQVDLYDIGLSVTSNEWVFLIHGKDNSLAANQGQGYIEQPVYYHTYGLAGNFGAAAIKSYSDLYGGSCYEAQTHTNSQGKIFSAEHYSNNPAIIINNYAPGGNASFMSVSQNVLSKDHFVAKQTVNQTSGFAFKVLDASDQVIAGIAAAGTNLYLKDVTTGTVKNIRINNGTLEVI